ncbi:DUF6085 family protein [Streptomyces sp. T028]|uniref:DUF6085 family protein n=1 Tax=Streptomyces sp. T028 TaxID=3394379 RepID=UPI003A8C2901
MSGGSAIAGYCPMGCGETLQRTQAATIACGSPHCPRPDAVAALLADQETEHVVQFDPDGFTIRHPLRERLDDDLMRCELHQFCTSLPGPPRDGCGQYRAIFLGPRDWVFRRTGGEQV